MNYTPQPETGSARDLLARAFEHLFRWGVCQAGERHEATLIFEWEGNRSTPKEPTGRVTVAASVDPMGPLTATLSLVDSAGRERYVPMQVDAVSAGRSPDVWSHIASMACGLHEIPKTTTATLTLPDLPRFDRHMDDLEATRKLNIARAAGDAGIGG